MSDRRPDAEPLAPGPAHPHPPAAPDDLADRLRVPSARVQAWLDAGLPATADGRIDPATAAAWLVDGRVRECPLLARRWRAWFAWFAPVLAGDSPRRLRVRRRAALHLPVAGGDLRWEIPRLLDGPGQRLLAERLPVGITAAGDRLLVERAAADGPLEVVLGADLGLTPIPSRAQADLLPLVEELAAGFRYGYRYHRPGEAHRGDAGSCLDCANELGRRLEVIGRPWRLVGGITARSAVAGLHVWVEVAVAGGAWVPVDPTMAVVARQLGGAGTDWRAWARAWTGGCDARRVVLARARPDAWAAAIGAAGLTVGGDRRDAWACIDLACGDCRWDFAVLNR